MYTTLGPLKLCGVVYVLFPIIISTINSFNVFDSSSAHNLSRTFPPSPNSVAAGGDGLVFFTPPAMLPPSPQSRRGSSLLSSPHSRSSAFATTSASSSQKSDQNPLSSPWPFMDLTAATHHRHTGVYAHSHQGTFVYLFDL
jgi:hypothetical protein